MLGSRLHNSSTPTCPNLGCFPSHAIAVLVFAAIMVGGLSSPAAWAWQTPGPGLDRIVEYRDGTLIRVEIPRGQLPWKSVTRDGQITELPTPMDSVSRLDFVLSPVTEQVAIVRQLISQLGAANYQQRQEAHKRLVEIGGQYRPVIAAAEESAEPEVRWRIQDILENVSITESYVRNDFDRLTLGDGTVLDGDVGNWELDVVYRGATLTLNRESVLSIYEGDLKLDFDGDTAIAEFERLPEDDPANFPVNIRRLDFEQKPGGEPLSVGEDVANAYVDAGVSISTSVPNAMVTVQSYKVRSGQSAATHSPPYTGTITLRFCVPGNPRLPASVRTIGCWVSYISPAGTYLQAYDARDRLIGEVATTVSGAEFLALSSSVPIAYCKLHPDDSVDPDYAFDEFVYDDPRPLLESGDPQLNSVVLYSGERLQALGLQLDKESIQLSDLTVGTGRITIPRAEIAVVIPRVDEDNALTGINRTPALPHVQMMNGSVVFVSPDPSLGLRLSRTEKGVIRQDEIASLWGKDTAPATATTEELEQGPFTIIEGERVAVPDIALGVNWITGSALEDRNLHFEYADSPVIWFQAPRTATRQHGIIRTSAGESFVFGANSFTLNEWNDEGIKLSWNSYEFMIPTAEISSIRFPFRD